MAADKTGGIRIGYIAIFIQGYVEVHTYDCLLTGKVEIVNCLHNL